jgi:hypothetical protein
MNYPGFSGSMALVSGMPGDRGIQFFHLLILREYVIYQKGILDLSARYDKIYIEGGGIWQKQ